MLNLHITKDESLKASLEAHDIVGRSQRFSQWAGTGLTRRICNEESLLSHIARKLPFQKCSPLLPPKDNSSTFFPRAHKT